MIIPSTWKNNAKYLEFLRQVLGDFTLSTWRLLKIELSLQAEAYLTAIIINTENPYY